MGKKTPRSHGQKEQKGDKEKSLKKTVDNGRLRSRKEKKKKSAGCSTVSSKLEKRGTKGESSNIQMGEHDDARRKKTHILGPLVRRKLTGRQGR